MRLLVVEDDDHLRHFLGIVLAAQHDVVCLDNGRDALQQLESNAPDMLLSDLDLPELSGEELAQSAAGSTTPPTILLWSGDHERLDRARPLAAATLTKPFSIIELAGLIERITREAARRTARQPKQVES